MVGDIKYISFTKSVIVALHVFVWILLFGFASIVSAATFTSYTSQAAYDAALPTVGVASTFEDFSSVVTNTTMATGAGDTWNGFSVSRTGTGVFGNSGYCPALSDPQSSAPTSCVGYNPNAPNLPGIVGSFAATTVPPASITFTPTNQIFSFSFDYVDWNDGSFRSEFTVFLSDGTSQTFPGVLGGLPGFQGLIIDQLSREAGVHITSIEWVGVTSELVGIWDVGTNYLQPELDVTKTFGAVTANADFTIDVPITIEVENTGQLNLNNLQVTDVLNAATNFAGAYIPSTAAVTTGGIISGPTVSVVDDGTVLTATAPTLNAAFDGGPANSEILNGATGALGPSDTLVINFTVRLDLTAGGGTYQNLATAKAEASNGDGVGDDSGAAAGGPGTPTPLIVPVLVRKSFAPDPIDAGDTSVLTISIRNPNASVLTGVSITDTYPVGDIINATPANGVSSCGGTVTAADGGASVALSGATIPASDGCTITVNVTSNVAGTHTNTTGPVSTNESADSTTATDDLTVNAAPLPFCPAGSSLTAQVGNAVVATETGNVINAGFATGAIEAVGTNATGANSARLTNANDELILDLGELVPTNGVVTISIARLNNAASVVIEDSEDGAAYSGGQIFNAGPNTALQHISYVVTAAAGARFIRITNQNFSDMWVDGVEYSQICDVPLDPPSCPIGGTLTAEVGNAVAATETGSVINAGLAAGTIEAVGTNATGANSARLINTNDELILDLGELVPTNSVVSISIARLNTNAIVLIEDSEDGAAYSGGQFFGNGPNTALQRIDYIVTAAGGAQFIRFTNQSFDDVWVDGVEYSQICDITPPPVCPVGSNLSAEVGNAVLATETGNVTNAGLATGAIEAVGTNASAANSARLQNTNDQLVLDLGEVLPTNSVVTISIARLNTNALVEIEDSEDGVVYSGGQLFGNGPNTALQRFDYTVTAAAGARFIRFTNNDFNDIWVDGVEYSQICDIPPPPPVCPAGSTLTAQVGNAVSASTTGFVANPANAVGTLQPLGTNAVAANSARIGSANSQLILDLGELVPTNSMVTISIARRTTNAIVLIEDSEDGAAYSGGEFFGNGPNTALQRIDYTVTAAGGTQFIRFTLQDFNNMWVDGVEYSEICDTAKVVDLTITKDDGNTTYTPGGTTTYTIVVTNNGPDDVTGATIADDLPDGVTMTAAWTCTPSSANSSCNTAPSTTDPISIDVDIVNGDTITVTVPVQFSANMGDY